VDGIFSGLSLGIIPAQFSESSEESKKYFSEDSWFCDQLTKPAPP
jgi:hypothetical protein